MSRQAPFGHNFSTNQRQPSLQDHIDEQLALLLNAPPEIRAFSLQLHRNNQLNPESLAQVLQLARAAVPAPTAGTLPPVQISITQTTPNAHNSLKQLWEGRS
jgi:hypothetical protein